MSITELGLVPSEEYYPLPFLHYPGSRPIDYWEVHEEGDKTDVKVILKIVNLKFTGDREIFDRRLTKKCNGLLTHKRDNCTKDGLKPYVSFVLFSLFSSYFERVSS